jgi:hypothetical protein
VTFPRLSRTCPPASVLAASLLGCAPNPPPAAPTAPGASAPASAPASTAAAPDAERGGRLYDSWRTERRLSASFSYDLPGTPTPDGKGGPNGNGTLNDGRGRPMLNTGHDYRLLSWFGWDLRGKQGEAGPAYHASPFALERNLLEDTRSPAEIRDWLAHGDEQIPAYGEVLDARDLDDLTAFLVQSRDGSIARPEQVFALDARAPGNYTLLPGADVARGHELFSFVCSDCHGKDGRELNIDQGGTVGAYARARGYEAWFKIQNGIAGSPMKGQITEPTGAAAAQNLLDLLAALCDRQLFPKHRSGGVDVPDGDPRCGAYLK